MILESSSAGTSSGAIRLRDLGGAAMIFCAVLLAYLPALSGGRLWDDDSHLTRPELRSVEGLGRIWSDPWATQQYYPLLHSAFWLEHRLWGEAVIGYHLVNVFLHAGSALLVVFIVRRLFAGASRICPQPGVSGPGGPAAEAGRYPGVDWLAGFIFALHPVCVESVAWISEQKNTLSGVFYLGAALAYLRFDADRRRSHYYAALALFLLALMSKTVTATLPAMLLVVIWWRRGRLEGARDVAPLLPWFELAVAAGVFSSWVEQSLVGASGADFELTLAQRGLLAGRVIWFYFGKLVWPADLSFFYPRWTVDARVIPQYWFPVLLLLVAVGLGLLSRRWRGPLAAFLFFVGTLLPVLGFFNVYPFVFSYVADHFQYLASLGVIVPAAAGLGRLAGRTAGSAGWAPRALRVLPVAGLAMLTWNQSGFYRDAATLYRATLARNPASWIAHNNLGNVLAKSPADQAEAVVEYRKALAIKPDLAEIHFNLANVLARTPAHQEEASAEYARALRLRPDYAEAHGNLGRVLARIPGRLPEAMIHFRTAVRLDPGAAEAHNNLAVALAMSPGGLSEALAEYDLTLRLRPDFAEAHFNRANALTKMPGRTAEAISEFETALRLAPDFAEAHCNLGTVLLMLPGRRAEALAHLEAAVRLHPDLEPARQLLERLRAAGGG